METIDSLVPDYSVNTDEDIPSEAYSFDNYL